MAGRIPDDWFRPENTETRVNPVAEDASTSISSVTVTDGDGSSYEITAERQIPAVADTQKRPHDTGRRSRVVAVLLIVGALVIGLMVGQLLRGSPSDTPQPVQPTPSAGAPAMSGSTTGPWTGRVRSVTPDKIVASCTAAPAEDSLGKPVAYGAANLSDGSLETAWRCDGSGSNQTVRFTLPKGTELVRLAVFNGYGKRDPKTGDLMYGQYRRVTAVSWKLPDGSWFDQEFADNGAGMQQVDIPVKAIDGAIAMTIKGSTQPGWTTIATRDAVLISEVQFFAPVQ